VLTGGNPHHNRLVLFLEDLRERNLVPRTAKQPNCQTRLQRGGVPGTRLSSINSTSGNASPALTERMAEPWSVRWPPATMAERKRRETGKRCNIAMVVCVG
jgi:hypothetical protein